MSIRTHLGLLVSLVTAGAVPVAAQTTSEPATPASDDDVKAVAAYVVSLGQKTGL